MKTISQITMENYSVEDREFIVGQGDNKHHVCVHTFQEYTHDEDGDEIPQDVWHIVVMVYQGAYKIGTANNTQRGYNASTYRTFLGAYKAACHQIGVTPIYRD